MLRYRNSNFLKADAKELLPMVHTIDPTVRELSVERRFKRGRVLAEDHRVDVEMERNRRVPKLLDAVQRLEAAGHADLVAIIAEASDIGEYVHVSGFR